MTKAEIEKYLTDKVAADGYAVVPVGDDITEKFGVKATTLAGIVRNLIPKGYLIQYVTLPITQGKTRKVIVPKGTTYYSLLQALRRDL